MIKKNDDVGLQNKEIFLSKNSINQYEIQEIKADCSLRRYERVITSSKTYILMICPVGGENFDMFIYMSKFLVENEFSAPNIFDYDDSKGFILMEDFGDSKFTEVFSNPENSEVEELAYNRAADVLIKLHNVEITDETNISRYSDEMLMKEVMQFADFYIPTLTGNELPNDKKEEFKEIWTHLFHHARLLPEVVVLRDYHADNLIWLEDRVSSKKVGLLDYQDAVIGSPAYDLVSLLEDARRDVPEKIIQSTIDRYLNGSNGKITRRELMAAYAILGAQRNCKIAGVFARKAIEGNNIYLKMLPRVLNNIKIDLKNPLLFPMKQWLAVNLAENFSLESYNKIKVNV